MFVRNAKIFRPVAFCFLVFLLLYPLSAPAITLDARRIAMGGALLPYHSESYVRNPAYLKIQEESPLTIPIPLGLFLFLGDLPSFDPNADDFDAIELINLFLNPPFYLELYDRNSVDSTEIFIDIAEDYMAVDLDNLKPYIPRGPVQSGIFGIQQPRVGYVFRDIHLGVSPFVIMEGNYENSSDLERVLAASEPLQSDADYSAASSGMINAGMAIQAGYAVELQDHFSIGESPRVIVGVNGKYLLGFLYGDYHLVSNLHTFDPIFGSEQPPEFSADVHIDHAIPESGDIGPKGRGFGFDAGLLLRYETLDIGFGIQDLYTRLDWRANREQLIFDDATNELVQITLFEDETVRSHIPRNFSLSIAYRDMSYGGWGFDPSPGDYLIASSFQVIQGDVSVHVGGETYFGPGPIAFRVGSYNQRERLQFSFGAGIPLKFFNFDIGFATHSSTFQQTRGLTMATSISLR
jgi:hypothetical protein